MNNQINATFIFKDLNQFQEFINRNGIEEYTWKKGEYTVDLSTTVKEAIKDLPAKIEEKKTAGSVF